MRSLSLVEVYFHDQLAGILQKKDDGTYHFKYDDHYEGSAISFTMPVAEKNYIYPTFPPFFDGLLPEGLHLTLLLKNHHLNETDYLGQLVAVGDNLMGAVNIKAPSV